MAKIAVVGAGIIGLSSAVCLQEQFPEVQVAIFAELQDIRTTSDVAAGIFHPDNVQVDDEAHLKQWVADSAEKYWDYCYSENAPNVGIFEMGGYTVSNFDIKLIEDPLFYAHVRNYHRLEGHELDKIGGGPWRYGCYKSTMIIESRIMMQYLFKQFLANGGTLHEQKLNSLAELKDWDVIINCSGLGARSLVGDQTMYPVRGQVMRVRAPWIKQFYQAEDDTYIIPNGELVVLGGTRQKRDWNTDLSNDDRESIMQRTGKLLPSVAQSTLVREFAGLRPGRPTVRLELENMAVRDREIPVIHNYGHGGNGIALSWGCGKHVARIAASLVNEYSAKPKNASN